MESLLVLTCILIVAVYLFAGLLFIIIEGRGIRAYLEWLENDRKEFYRKKIEELFQKHEIE